MNNIYNQYLVGSKFVNYLFALNLSRVTVYNYKSDTKNFLLWLYKNNINQLGYLDNAIVSTYIDILCCNQNRQIVKRQFSSLRKFTAFLADCSYISFSLVNSINSKLDKSLLSFKREAAMEVLNRDIRNGSLSSVNNELFIEFT
jgi:site-specific recombinase XerD